MALEPLFIDLILVYRDAYQTLMARLTAQEVRGLSTAHTKALLSDIEEIISQLKQYQLDWINHTIPLGYQEGSDAVVDKLTKRYGMTDINVSFGGIHTQAVNAIVRDTFNDIAAATNFMAENLKQAIRNAAKEQYQIGLITGETQRGMTKGLVGELNKKGFTAYLDEKGRYIPLREYANTLLSEQWVGFVDKAGRRWDLLNYSEMLTRTKVLEATNVGTENRLTQNGMDLVLISSHHADDWCRFYENRVFSISGKSSEYPPLSQVPNGGCPMHPRCKHSETPFIEKFESDDVIKYGKGIDKKYLGLNTEKGHADQAALRKLEKETSIFGQPFKITKSRDIGNFEKAPEGFRDNLKKAYKTTDPRIIGLTNKYMDKIACETISPNSTPHFKPSTKKMYLHSSSSESIHEQTTTFIHEYGHMIDNYLAVPGDKTDYRFYSDDQYFTDIINTTTRKYIGSTDEAVSNREKIQEALRKAKVYTDSGIDYPACNLHDIYSALTRNMVRVSAGHSSDYWEHELMSNKEIFTNIYLLYSTNREDLIQLIKENDPDILKAFEELLNRIFE